MQMKSADNMPPNNNDIKNDDFSAFLFTGRHLKFS